MHIICLTPLAPGVYNDHKADHITAHPDGWAVIPEGIPLPATFPRLGSIEAEEIDGRMTVTAMAEGTLPEEPALSPAEQREAVYNTAQIIPWDSVTVTVTGAAQLWQYYAAEGNPKAAQLQALIAAAKADIRAQIPDE